MSARPTPPIPPSRPDRQSFLRSWITARRNLFSALPERLYRARLAEAKTPWFRSFLANEPELVRRVLVSEHRNFPKSPIQSRVLGDLLGQSVFVTNGDLWERQRRLIDPAFQASRPRKMFAPMLDAAKAMEKRLRESDGIVDLEFEASFTAADIIFRTLFSRPIENEMARRVFESFRDYQLSAPMVSGADVLGLPRWVPRFTPRRRIRRRAAKEIRSLLSQLVIDRQKEIESKAAPDDLATAIMTAKDPIDGSSFSPEEMVDQVGIFFLAGHETSASALAWALYLLAIDPSVQSEVHRESSAVFSSDPGFRKLKHLSLTRDVFRETLRLYPPVPMMIREAQTETIMRDKDIPAGSPVIISPWHLGRHERIWADPDVFDPYRWTRPETRDSAREAHIPFSTGPRVCSGAGFAMQEGVILLGYLTSALKFDPIDGKMPEPMMHLTVRSRNGIWLKVSPRVPSAQTEIGL